MKYINRELSWLEFNQRVLSQAQRDDLPLLDRLKFIAITASNLDEFFQVRVGGLTALANSGSRRKDLTGLTPRQQLRAIRNRVNTMLEDTYSLFNDTLIPKLAKKRLHLVSDYNTLTALQRQELSKRFTSSILPLLTPLGYIADEPTPTLPSLRLIVALTLQRETSAEHEERTVFIPIPENLERFTHLIEQKEEYVICIEDIIEHNAQSMFADETITHISHFRITRNSDIVLHDDISLDIAGEMQEILIDRNFSNTVRLEIPTTMPRSIEQTIRTITAAQPEHIYRIPGRINLADYMPIAFLPNYDKLREPQWQPQPSPALPPEKSVFEAITAKDILLYHPYESFEPVIRFIEEAAADPHTIAIKQVLYRTAKDSRIIDALIKAAHNGKQVTVLVELKARFDEARNLQRADELQRAGIQIVYGVRHLKTHAKILLIVRNENGKLKRYMHLGTGNYNESTAKLYTDASYLTDNPNIANDASAFFNAITGRSKLPQLKKLIPAPTQMKRTLLDKIASEAKRAGNGETAHIIAKVNSLQDKDIIDALYDASKAGVKIQLNVRGICCLRPQVPKLSENIEVVSIIDRYLEHARIFYFHQGGTPSLFIASADWMTRNLEKRVELMIPILEPSAKKRLLEILCAAFEDNTNAYIIQPDGTSTIKTPPKKSRFRMQYELQQAAEKATMANAKIQASTFEPHRPKS